MNTLVVATCQFVTIVFYHSQLELGEDELSEVFEQFGRLNQTDEN